ncbi:MAG: hypothetical protein BWY47_00144 [Bacteroidetes bacterium ADurb.Bin302]|nr:MAG: hypothetical protein BWY47_00144 [Bacteroidetes bacterium ADurb.Bin302]
MKLDFTDTEGWLTPFEGYALMQMASVASNGILNIGCYKGKSIEYMRMCNQEISIYAVDILIQPEIKKIPNVIPIQGDSGSIQIASQIPEGLDLVFIDGDHMYNGVINDLKNYYYKVRPGGCIMLHDAFSPAGEEINPWKGVMEAFIDFFWDMNNQKLGDITYANTFYGKYYNKVDTSLIIQKKEEV